MEDILKALLTTPEGIVAVISQYKPLLYAICGELFSIYKDLVNNDEWYTVNAVNDRKRFESLVNTGFTENQAIQIMIAKSQNFKNYAQNTSGVKLNLNQ